MENSFQQFDYSLTRQVEISMNEWTKELADMSYEIMNNPMRIVNSLNDIRNICTPGFLMRREIQRKFPELLETASDETKEQYADLLVNNNIAWPKELMKNLCLKLEKHFKKECDQLIKASQWKAWLTDEGFPTKRELAIKLSFLLEMDDYTTTKFLLACGHEPFSERNPLDCICLFCKLLRPKGNWKKVEEILTQYEKKRPPQTINGTRKIQKVGNPGMTRMISNKIPALAEISVSEPKLDAPDKLLEYMYSIDDEFTRHKTISKKDTRENRAYLSGYSLQRCQDLLKLTKYLVELYPCYDNAVYVGGDRRINSHSKKKGDTLFNPAITYCTESMKKVQIDENGYPNLIDLSRAFVYFHEWDFEEPSGLGLVGINPKTGKAFRTSAKKEKHDKIPFNRYIYTLCKTYAENNRLSGIALILNQIENAIPVERKDILLMAYLFISAYSRQNDNNKLTEKLYNMAEAKSKDDAFSSGMESILGQLEDIAVLCNEPELISAYISCINQFLLLFNFEPFYPPFLLDRFILFALVGEEIGSVYLTDDGMPANLTGIWLSDGYSNMPDNP